MKTKRTHVIDKIKNYDKLNNLDLRSDIENGNIFDTYLQNEGLIEKYPDTWGIVCTMKNDNDIIDNYLYESQMEHEQDLKILGLSS